MTDKAQSSAACPTPCDDDCEQPCHEVHQVTPKQTHRPEDCPGRYECKRGHPVEPCGGEMSAENAAPQQEGYCTCDGYDPRINVTCGIREHREQARERLSLYGPAYREGEAQW